RLDLLFRTNHADAEFGFEQGVERAAVGREQFGRQAFEGCSRQPDVVKNGGRLVERKYTTQVDDRVAGTQLQQGCHIGRRAQALAFENSTSGYGGMSVVRR